jgi:hypothetical protein
MSGNQTEFSIIQMTEWKVFTQEVLNGFQITARMAAMEIPTSRAGHRAFVGVYPPSPGKDTQQWRVRRFEIPNELVEEYFAEDQMLDSQFIHLDTLQQVERLISDWGLDSAAFAAPWKNDWPL